MSAGSSRESSIGRKSTTAAGSAPAAGATAAAGRDERAAAMPTSNSTARKRRHGAFNIPTEESRKAKYAARAKADAEKKEEAAKAESKANDDAPRGGNSKEGAVTPGEVMAESKRNEEASDDLTEMDEDNEVNIEVDAPMESANDGDVSMDGDDQDGTSHTLEGTERCTRSSQA